MSRSRKKTAGWSKRDTLQKKKFNRSLRRKANQAILLEDEGGWEIIDGDLDWFHYEQYMSYEIGNGKEYKKHNCSWDIRDYHGLWLGGYREYKARLSYWEILFPEFPDFWADEWWKEKMK